MKYTIDYNDRITDAVSTYFRVVYDDGTKGGYVESEKNLSQHGNCKVLDSAIVRGGSVVRDNAIVKDHALIDGESVISGNAVVGGYSNVLDETFVLENAVIMGRTQLKSCFIEGNTKLTDMRNVIGCNFGGDLEISNISQSLHRIVLYKHFQFLEDDIIYTHTWMFNLPLIHVLNKEKGRDIWLYHSGEYIGDKEGLIAYSKENDKGVTESMFSDYIDFLIKNEAN